MRYAADDGLGQGTAIEEYVRTVAARLGVADFVMIPEVRSKSSGQREVSDGCLVCGALGAVLQVKAREPEAAMADTPEKAARWIAKHVRAAIRQGRGTKRTLSSATASHPVVLRPVRSLEAPVERRDEFARRLPADVSSWPIVVVVEHEQPPPIRLEVDEDVFVLTLQDWMFLNAAIRSTAGLLDYVDRVRANRAALDVPLGHERLRFSAFCDADDATNDGSPTWIPWLSRQALEDPKAADMFQHFIDRAWPRDKPLPYLPPADHLEVVEFLDRVPPTLRVHIGRRWHTYVEATKEQGRRSGASVVPHGVVLMVVEHTRERGTEETFLARLSALAMVRADEFGEVLASRPVLAIGALTHPGATDYLFVLIRDPAALDPLPAEIVDAVHDEFGRLADVLGPLGKSSSWKQATT